MPNTLNSNTSFSVGALLQRTFNVQFQLFAFLRPRLELSVFGIKIKFIILWLVIFRTEGLASPIGIISDIDDTVKITNVQSTLGAIISPFESVEFFAGMTELYNELLTFEDNLISENNLLFLLSGSPELLYSKLDRAFKKKRFPPFEMILKNWLSDGQTRYFKYRELRKIFLKTKMQFLLIGDDTDFDPEVYVDFKYYYPEAVSEIYIRRIKGREIPQRAYDFASYNYLEVNPFYTALDIAAHEFNKKRLYEDQVYTIALSLMMAPIETIIPDFALCPRLYRVPTISGFISVYLRDLVNKLEAKVSDHCQSK